MQSLPQQWREKAVEALLSMENAPAAPEKGHCSFLHNLSEDSRRIGCVGRSEIMSIAYLDYQVPLAIVYNSLGLLLCCFAYRHADRFSNKKAAREQTEDGPSLSAKQPPG